MSDTNISGLASTLFTQLEITPEGEEPITGVYAGGVRITYSPVKDRMYVHIDDGEDDEEASREEVEFWEETPMGWVSYFNPEPEHLPVIIDEQAIRTSNSAAFLASFIDRVNKMVDNGHPAVYHTQKIPLEYLPAFTEHFVTHFTQQMQTVSEA
ncbi:hypothetical protein CMO88_00805 [Candidatus Woesearchaeota archaeon]|nr:hypothetical protein [Candidatus Woesearchaeota archaeon]|tara:strand:+ start:16419 stop:16880 length:462 start_codon:yes stop_codon:yes gene_type:complete